MCATHFIALFTFIEGVWNITHSICEASLSIEIFQTLKC